MYRYRRNISKHALNRMIERNVLCQNKKLNKKQVKRNTKKAIKQINEGLNNYFATGISSDKRFKYKYSKLSNDGICKKYVLSSTGNLITIINNINFSSEIEKYNIKLRKNNIYKEKYTLNDFIYKTYENNMFVFYVSLEKDNICFFSTKKNDRMVA